MSARLADFEYAAYRRDHERALALLMEVLREIESGRPPMTSDRDGMTATATRFASAITALFSDPGLRLSQQGYERLIVFNRALNVVFGASAFEHSGHLMRAIAKRPKKPDDWRKLLVVTSLDSMGAELFAGLKSAPGEVVLPAVCALLTGSIALTDTAEQARATLLRMGRRLRKARLTDATLETLAIAWMTCSYGHDEQKHDLKGHLNHLLEQWMAARGISDSALVTPSGRTRPRLVVCAEWWTSFHAMYRCYGPSVAQLRERFEVVLLVEPTRVDGAARASVDRTVELAFQTPNIEPFVRAVRELAPDVIFYPSLGMSVWTVCLANLRLAPLQIMTLGHPGAVSVSAYRLRIDRNRPRRRAGAIYRAAGFVEKGRASVCARRRTRAGTLIP